MRSVLLDEATAQEIVRCLGAAAGELEHTLELLKEKVTDDDFDRYKRKIAKVIIAIHNGLIGAVLENFPDLKRELYENR
jgi:hypothetical protein